MAWITIGKRHVNTDRVDVFLWEDGNLYLFFTGDEESTKFRDPNRMAYTRLCDLLDMIPYKEE